jgi:ATP-dependent helicase/nuclease subunit B
MPAHRRQLLLARLVMAEGGMTADRAARLAADLARLIDQVETERIGFAGLARLAPEDLAGHWQETLEFLRIVTHHWPMVLTAEGAIDAASRRNLLLDAQGRAWSAAPPAGIVLAAGSTGTIPATAALLGVIARLPRGAVVLPGLDDGMDEAAWQDLDETHPQAAMKRLLERIGIPRAEVRPWPAPGLAAPRPDRRRLVGEVMRPAGTTDAWRNAASLSAADLAGLSRIDCPSPQEEAAAIALLMRQALEVPGRTAALLTPDRTLARRVAAALGRWDITIDDSAGTALADTPAGTFFRLAAHAAAARAAPLDLLALLKHPLAAAGGPPGVLRARTRRLERATLRGPRPAPGWPGLALAVEAAAAQAPEGARRPLATLAAWVARLAALAREFFEAVEGPPTPLGRLIRLHAGFAERLAAVPGRDGARRLWAHEDGEALALFVEEIAAAADALEPLDGAHYPALVETLMEGRAVRRRRGEHPRLAIWGPLEARLQRADLLILGGLNEGTWPRPSDPGPWLSRPMRRDFGLPPLERRIGLAAHDVAQAMAAGEVVLTRSARVDGTPTVPSRWLMRLEGVLAAAGLAMPSLDAPLAWARALDAPAGPPAPVPPPAPRPPAGLRPRRLSVSDVGRLMCDPYHVYAQRILRLRVLDEIDESPGAADRGTLIHDILATFLGAHRDGPLPADAEARLLAVGRTAFGRLAAHPGVGAFWWPRFVRIAAWFLAEETRRRRAGIVSLALEVDGRMGWPAPLGEVVLSARADRIDRLADGIEVIDYKTGSVPREPAMAAGFAPQLPLEAVMVEAGAFSGVAAAPVTRIAHWKLAGGREPGRIHAVPPGKAEAMIADARAGFARLIAEFDDPATAYLSEPRPKYTPRYNDFAHLARTQEWSAVSEVPEE